MDYDRQWTQSDDKSSHWPFLPGEPIKRWDSKRNTQITKRNLNASINGWKKNGNSEVCYRISHFFSPIYAGLPDDDIVSIE